MTRRIRVFVDTNLFLQCRPLAELRWAELFDSDHIDLLVPGPVLDEIDRLKGDGNSRRAKRARTAAKLFRDTLRSPDLSRVIREADPRVTLSFPAMLPRDRPVHPALDLTRGDDRLLEEALFHRNSGCADASTTDVRLLTHDSGLILRARRNEMPYVEIPDDWLLAPEPGELEKRIAAQEVQIQRLQGASPVLVLEATNRSGRIAQKLEVDIPIYEALSREEIHALERDVLARHPMKADFSPTQMVLPRLFPVQWQRPSDDEIHKYQAEAYPAWRERVLKVIASLADDLNARSSAFDLTVVLRNDGSRPADRAIVEFVAQGAILLGAPCRASDHDQDHDGDGDGDGDGDEDDDEITSPTDDASQEGPAASADLHLILPRPPEPPAGQYVSGVLSDRLGLLNAFDRLSGHAALRALSLPHVSLPKLPQPRDPHAFYWKGGRPLGIRETWTLECEDFRHGLDPQIFNLHLIVPQHFPNQPAAHANLRCRVSASNMAEPVTLSVPIVLRFRHESTLAIARGWQLAQEETTKPS